MFRKKELEKLARECKYLREQVGGTNRRVLGFESEIKRQTILNRSKRGYLGGYLIFDDGSTPPEVFVVDAVQLILDHLGLEIVENEKLSLTEKEED